MTSHDPDCPDHHHAGACTGPLRFELPESPEDRYERRVTAIEYVLINSPLVVIADLRELAEQCLAAADTEF